MPMKTNKKSPNRSTLHLFWPVGGAIGLDKYHPSSFVVRNTTRDIK
jgi:hypothetical protein